MRHAKPGSIDRRCFALLLLARSAATNDLDATAAKRIENVIAAEGHSYASQFVGFGFTDCAAGKLQDKQWYQTDILEPTPLTDLPAGLTTLGVTDLVHDSV